MTWHFTITSDMREKLGLTGNELLIYAVIAGYSANGQGCYYGNQDYLSELTGTTRRTVNKVLQDLVDRGLIVKVGQWSNKDNRTCHYEVAGMCEKNSHICEKNLHTMGEKSSHTQEPYQDKEEKYNNKYNNKYILYLLDSGCTEESIDDWLAARKAKHSVPVNQSVINYLEREAATANISVAKAVSIAAECGWQNFTAKWYFDRIRLPESDRPKQSVYERNLAEMRRGGLIDDNGNLV